jgi:hypothetical protein
METIIQQRRREAGLTIRDLAKALGPGFSIGRLSMGERGLIDIPAHDEKAILGAIERLAPLHRHRRKILTLARDMDFGNLVADVREARCAAAHV